MEVDTLRSELFPTYFPLGLASQGPRKVLSNFLDKFSNGAVTGLTYVYLCHKPITITTKIVTGYEPTQVTEIWLIDWEQNNTKKTEVVIMHE